MPSFSADEERRSFSTFGKDVEDEEEDVDAGGDKSLLSDINSVFHRLAPSSYPESADVPEGPTSVENKKCLLPGNFQNSNSHGSMAKWLPPVEEIPENYEEEEMESAADQCNHGQDNDEEFCAEINQLLLDVRLS